MDNSTQDCVSLLARLARVVYETSAVVDRAVVGSARSLGAITCAFLFFFSAGQRVCYVVCANVLLRADHAAAQRATQAARVPSPARPARAPRRVGMRDFHTVAGCGRGGLSTSAEGLCRETARRLPKVSRPRRRLLFCSVV